MVITVLVIIAVLAVIGWMADARKFSSRAAQDSSDLGGSRDKPTGNVDQCPDNDSVAAKREAQEILEKVEARRTRAEEVGLDKIVPRVYRDVRCYPSWKEKNLVPLPAIVEDVKTSKAGETEIVQVRLNGRDYTFHWTDAQDHDYDDPYLRAQLDLFDEQKRRIFALPMAMDTEPEWSDWEPCVIEAFIEGDWVEDFRKLHETILEREKKSTARMQLDQAHKLKKDFGL